MDTKNFFIEVAKGNIPGHSLVHKFGRNDDVPNNSWEIVSLLSTSGAFRASPSTIRIKVGGNAADTFDGSGARTVTVIGLDEDLNEVSEVIATSGASASSATTTSFWRVYRSYISSVGTYGGMNVGNIIIEDSGGEADIIKIDVNNGQTQHAAYSIPAGKTGYLLSVHLTVDAAKAADFRLFTREDLTNVTAPMSPVRSRLYWDGILGSAPYQPDTPEFPLLAGTDIWIEARGGGANTEVSANFEILLVDNPVPDIKVLQ